MKTMTETTKVELLSRVEKRWAEADLKAKSVKADAIWDICSWGLSMTDVAEALPVTDSTVGNYLDVAIIEKAQGLEDNAKTRFDVTPTAREANYIFKKYAPKEPNEALVEEYEQQGFTSQVARRLATNYQAAETAIKKGILKETHEQSSKKSKDALFGPSHQWSIDLQRLCTQVKSASRTLDQAKITDLKKVGTRKLIAAAHAKWMEQIERLQNFHSDFDSEVMNHEA